MASSGLIFFLLIMTEPKDVSMAMVESVSAVMVPETLSPDFR